MTSDCLRTGIPCLMAACLYRFFPGWIGSLVALGCLIFLWVPARQRLKAPDVTVGLGFMLIIVGGWVLGEVGVSSWRGAVIPGLLSVMAFGSVLLNQPFTTSYAKEMSGPEIWGLPHFLVVNQILSLFWALLFMVLFFFCAALSVSGGDHPFACWIVAGTFLLAGFRFTAWYPIWHEKRFVGHLKDKTSGYAVPPG